MTDYVTYNDAYPFDSPSGFVPNAYLGKCDCIRNITVVGHGQKYGNGLVQFTAGYIDLSEDNTREEISELFSGVRFCDKCHIIMKACWLGSSQVLWNNIQRKTGCTVDLYDRPTNTLPFVDPFVGLWYWLKYMMGGK